MDLVQLGLVADDHLRSLDDFHSWTRQAFKTIIAYSDDVDFVDFHFGFFLKHRFCRIPKGAKGRSSIRKKEQT
jgi:hypothetical protein